MMPSGLTVILVVLLNSFLYRNTTPPIRRMPATMPTVKSFAIAPMTRKLMSQPKNTIPVLKTNMAALKCAP
ncbi:hypothetical protein OR214_04714 [Ralstonia pickettii OR214]|uniref:Uncharacterized protein n=1 Tax=Ralstonia pickettii OR214 TaxID=1264675 RepID=R0E164_RALPI|nr:hypothetical protein OR214_04714 [Ralstonia pickettii OR214]